MRDNREPILLQASGNRAAFVEHSRGKHAGSPIILSRNPPRGRSIVASLRCRPQPVKQSALHRNPSLSTRPCHQHRTIPFSETGYPFRCGPTHRSLFQHAIRGWRYISECTGPLLISEVKWRRTSQCRGGGTARQDLRALAGSLPQIVNQIVFPRLMIEINEMIDMTRTNEMKQFDVRCIA